MHAEVAIDDLVPLFDALSDVVFFAKDGAGRYTHVNLTLVRRLGLDSRADLIGKSATELFPASLGRSYAAQDQRVLRGEIIEHQLEVHIFNNRAAGWCITFKRPLRSPRGIDGVIGISRDLGQPDGRHPAWERVRQVLDHIQAHYGEPLRVAGLAAMAGLSVAQLERHFRRVFQLTPQQMLTKVRIDAAIGLLQGGDSVAAIGQACGFADQSAFARQFKATTGMTPRDYRRLAGTTGD
ncbi:MAG: Transcriptional regulator, AraC family [Rhodanobacteraceae bacterium]|nr:MAG: Transcriptional regulator, AraC family [Rhodanobacteraceae bacterium]